MGIRHFDEIIQRSLLIHVQPRGERARLIVVCR